MERNRTDVIHQVRAARAYNRAAKFAIVSGDARRARSLHRRADRLVRAALKRKERAA